jgi:hypothetical protein
MALPASLFLVFQCHQIALSHVGSSEERGNHLHGSNFIGLKNCDLRSKRKNEALIFIHIKMSSNGLHEHFVVVTFHQGKVKVNFRMIF